MMHRKPNQEYDSFFVTLRSIKIPNPIRILAYLTLCFIGLIFITLLAVPWVQTSSGVGTITALNPEDRLQTINALVPGRIGQWYVRDGQRVKKGDPIVEILDNDPNIVSRLEGERDATLSELESAERAAATAKLDYDRQKNLFNQGLSARKDFERAKIQFETLSASVASIQAKLNKAETQLSRQTTQRILAPRDGTILSINAGDAATFVQTGQVLATFFPDSVQLAAEIYVNGLDAPLIYPGREVRLIFEGWPAVQFSGWPSTAIGTFKGVVKVVDPALSQNGRIRVLVVESEDQKWPAAQFLRYGAKAQAWVLLDTVQLGYEIWRQLNNFPPEFSQQSLERARQQQGIY